MIELDIVERLRGKVRVPVNDGAGLLDGKDFFERTFPTSKAAMEAAEEIERLRIDRDKWHRIAMEAGAITCSDGGHLYPLKEEVIRLRTQLAEAKKALDGMDLMMRFVDEWPNSDGIVSHVDCKSLRELRLALTIGNRK